MTFPADAETVRVDPATTRDCDGYPGLAPVPVESLLDADDFAILAMERAECCGDPGDCGTCGA